MGLAFLKEALPIGLAPMAGMGDSAMRTICVSFGASYTVSEMVSARALSMGDKKSVRLMEFTESERPYGIQLFGADPQDLRKAAGIAASFEPDFIDINCGCPVPKIVAGGAGSSLQRTPERIGELVAAVKSASGLPVSVKMRLGWDEQLRTAPQCIKAAEQAGAEFICVHARLRSDFYHPPVDIEGLRSAADICGIPFFANGDISGGETARRMLVPGAKGLAVARGALGAPWIFSRIRAELDAGPDVFKPKTIEEIIDCALTHIGLMFSRKNEREAALQARPHAAYYIKGVRGAAKLRAKAVSCSSFEDYRELFLKLLPAACEEDD